MKVVVPSQGSKIQPLSPSGLSAIWPVPIFNWFLGVDSLTSSWADLVNSWLALEEAAGFAKSRRLRGSDRPDAITDWIKYGRPAGYTPRSTLTPDEYELLFWSWWIACQPVFRQASKSTDSGVEQLQPLQASDTVDEGWSILNSTGSNGVVSAVAGLCIWGLFISPLQSNGFREQANRCRCIERWEYAMRDVKTALRQVLQLR